MVAGDLLVGCKCRLQMQVSNADCRCRLQMQFAGYSLQMQSADVGCRCRLQVADCKCKICLVSAPFYPGANFLLGCGLRVDHR